MTFIKFRKFLAILSPHQFLFSLFQESNDTNFRHYVIFPQVPQIVSFLNFFSFCSSEWLIFFTIFKFTDHFFCYLHSALQDIHGSLFLSIIFSVLNIYFISTSMLRTLTFPFTSRVFRLTSWHFKVYV